MCVCMCVLFKYSIHFTFFLAYSLIYNFFLMFSRYLFVCLCLNQCVWFVCMCVCVWLRLVGTFGARDFITFSFCFTQSLRFFLALKSSVISLSVFRNGKLDKKENTLEKCLRIGQFVERKEKNYEQKSCSSFLFFCILKGDFVRNVYAFFCFFFFCYQSRMEKEIPFWIYTFCLSLIWPILMVSRFVVDWIELFAINLGNMMRHYRTSVSLDNLYVCESVGANKKHFKIL